MRSWSRSQRSADSRRYHWPNAPIADGHEYAMAEQDRDLEQLLDSCGITLAHFVGHSYGAYLVLMLALRSPDLVEKSCSRCPR